jgi:methyl-accepting chemotaxis protein
MKGNKRKIILIDRPFQFRLILKFIAVNIVIMMIFAFFMYLFIDSELETNLLSAHVTFKNLRAMLLPIILTLCLLNLIISSVLIFVFVLFASHRIAGPLYRIHMLIDSMANRDLDISTKLRDGDQFHEIAAAIESLSTTFSGDMREINDLAEQIKENAQTEAAAEKCVEDSQRILRITDRYKI